MKRSLGGYSVWVFSALVVTLLLAAPGTHAATLNVVSGILVGASGVDVGGTPYDVEFLDGTCIALFSGCDSAADFTFTTSSAATAASQALLDQVFLDGASGQFDSHPELTLGCNRQGQCSVFTPYLVVPAIPTSFVFSIRADNASPENFSDGTAGSSMFDSWDSSVNDTVYARWSTAAVPEPGTGLLTGLGLLVMGAHTRRRYDEAVLAFR